jgi:glutaminase
MPGKGAVGGGNLAIALRRAAVAVRSPGLNTAGNSLVGALAFQTPGAARRLVAF